ncbi:hypothetical protein [Burkholderia anthina]|uniref:hypothetical protein n=1 Tax=Burkholderia anthina TaxID=179879 RepID=UPI00158C6FA3|nr:hypothetical protein [Burkholderia anthina]
MKKAMPFAAAIGIVQAIPALPNRLMILLGLQTECRFTATRRRVFHIFSRCQRIESDADLAGEQSGVTVEIRGVYMLGAFRKYEPAKCQWWKG